MDELNIFVEKDYTEFHDSNYNEFCEENNLPKLRLCPACNTNVHMKLICEIVKDEFHYIMVECPKCDAIIVKKYKDIGVRSDYLDGTLEVYPQKIKTKEFESSVMNISEMFVSIFNQALAAESMGLDQIAGIGYRKAIEFLIKDYAIGKNPSDTENIKKKPLMQCINDYVTEPKIKKMVTGAVWIGNDETHYTKKWADKDIKDLKKLIDITVYWMNFEILTEEYQKTMSL